MDRYKFPEKHGLWKEHKREHQCWQDMIQRCTNEKHRAYKNYGARGILICDEWLNDFANFFNDMGIRPEGLTLDRIDNNKGYSKDNCRWASNAQQMRNTRMSASKTTGVWYSKQYNNYRASIHVNKKQIYLGTFKTQDEAIKARKDAEQLYWNKH